MSRVDASADGVLTPTVTAAEKHTRRATTLGKRRKMPRSATRCLPRLPSMKRGTDQRYKQVYLTAFYDQTKDHPLVGVTRKNHRGLGKLLRQEAARVRLRGATERIGLVDGAVCLRQHLEALPLQEVTDVAGTWAPGRWNRCAASPPTESKAAAGGGTWTTPRR